MEGIEYYITGIGIVLSFYLGWKVRLQMTVNELNKLMAKNIEGDRNRDKEILEMKGKMNKIEDKIDALTLALTDWKQTSNSIMSKIQDLLD